MESNISLVNQNLSMPFKRMARLANLCLGGPMILVGASNPVVDNHKVWYSTKGEEIIRCRVRLQKIITNDRRLLHEMIRLLVSLDINKRIKKGDLQKEYMERLRVVANRFLDIMVNN